MERLGRVLQLLPTEVGRDCDSEYLHWDKLKYKPLPEGVASHEDWWNITKFRRISVYRHLPLVAKDNTPFLYWLPDSAQQKLHLVDQQASGRIEIPELVTNTHGRDRYLVNSLIEEAITSSQLEGASTTRKVAKAMLREGRKPRDKSEQMIFNNYQALSFIRECVDSPLTNELIFELHKVVTRGTLNDSSDEGRLRRPEEKIAVYDARDDTLLHDPPPAAQLEERLAALCRFANDDNPAGVFLHPVVRSIILHFMIGYDHPFVDGNGRTARALFYWSMARHRYWLMEYVSISTVLKIAPSQYARAYLYTECDDNDVTYFIDFNLTIILRAIGKLQRYLSTKAKEVKQVEQVLGTSIFARSLNDRQLALLSHAIRNPGSTYTMESHRESHRITYPTARADLLRLVELGLLEKHKVKRSFVFKAIDRLDERLAQLGSKTS